MLQVGLERFLKEQASKYHGYRLGYLSNQASTGRSLIHGRILLKEKLGDSLSCLFSPQHGFYSEKQDNMIESDHSVDPVTGCPVFSLYGEHRKPTKKMFDHLDILLVDLIDVGTRVYTFMYTMAYCLEVAAELGKKVVILDRPNPVGGDRIEGNLLKEDCSSFVGLYPIPMRYALTLGELALFFNKECTIGAELEVIQVSGWSREDTFRQTGFPWVSPSPNMPTPETAMVYPGQVIWEGTTVSEGRGTTLPFELFGAPYFKHEEILEYISSTDMPGCFLRPIMFEPTSGKWAQTLCTGFQLHVTDPDIFLPYRTSLALLQAAMVLYKEDFRYKEPPYEYEFERLPMDLILGDGDVRRQLEQEVPIQEIEAGWNEDLRQFDETRTQYFLY